MAGLLVSVVRIDQRRLAAVTFFALGHSSPLGSISEKTAMIIPIANVFIVQDPFLARGRVSVTNEGKKYPRGGHLAAPGASY